MVKVTIHYLNNVQSLDFQEGTYVSEVLEFILDTIFELEESQDINVIQKINKNVQYWTCFSLTQKRVLHHKEILKSQKNEELQIFFEQKDNFSEILANKEEKNLIESQISTERTFTKQSILNSKNIIIIVLDGSQQQIEIDSGTSVKELLQFLAKNNQLDQKKISDWICFSESQKRVMKLDEQIGNQQMEIYKVSTYKDQHKQSRSLGQKEVQTLNQGNSLQKQYYNDFHKLDNCSKTITLTIEIRDNTVVRYLTAMFLEGQTIEHIAQDVLRFSSLSIEQVSIDIFINQKQFNNPDKRALTLEDAKLNKQSKIVASIRWIN